MWEGNVTPASHSDDIAASDEAGGNPGRHVTQAIEIGIVYCRVGVSKQWSINRAVPNKQH